MTIEQQAAEIISKLPTRVKAEAESLRSLGERERWASGDLAAELVEELRSYNPTAVRMAVGKLYAVPVKTIMDRERVCRRVDSESRKAHPALTYHHWRACCNAGANLWEYVNQIEAHLGAWGSLPTVEQVYGWQRSNGHDANLPWVSRLESWLAQSDKLAHDDQAPGWLRELARGVGERVRSEQGEGSLAHDANSRGDRDNNKQGGTA